MKIHYANSIRPLKTYYFRMKKKKNISKTYNKKELTSKIIGIFSGSPSVKLNYKQVAGRLDISDNSMRMLISEVLRELTSGGILDEIQTGKYKYKHKEAYITGTVDITSWGSAYIVSDDISEDVFISRESLNTALHGDTVKVLVRSRMKRGRAEGEVVSVITRARETFVGIIERTQTYGFLLPDKKNMPYDIFIPASKLGNAQTGDKAIVKITEWSNRVKNPVGEIVRILGKAGENDTEMHAILEEFQLPYQFSDELNEIVNHISGDISEEEIKSRRDFREIPTFTIDPEDAKDFDDAISLRKLENGNFEVGVHIADVSHYVTPGSPADREAHERATSVYLVDRVVPMLPEKISNVVCSLRPNEEKLCFSAVFEMDENAMVVTEWFGKTVINSDNRFTYAEAELVIETEEGIMSEDILILNGLAQKMRNDRFKAGAISFERSEVKFKIDEKGKPLAVFFREHGKANELIEEFMLLANKRVAEKIGKKLKGGIAKPFVYRIHDKPDIEKLTSFSEFVKRFGYSIKATTGKSASTAINNLLKQVEGKKEQNLIETLAVRAMAKAKYSPHNIGHYGLAFTHYTHFTSPIRRYPDLLVHRLLEKYLSNEKLYDESELESLCNHCSYMENQATHAERASVKFKQVEFLSDKIGQEFDGIISGVTDWGIFVELSENMVEGMISLRSMDDDVYVFDEDDYCIYGKYKNKSYRLGDEIRIIVEKADLAKKQLDFKIVEKGKSL